MNWITTTESLAALCDRFAKEPFIAVDTEFMRETTYWSKLCLIQIAGAKEIALIDSLADDIDLTPFFELMVNRNVIKVFHAARQDIEIIWHRARVMPTPVVDTQIAAMVLGFGDQIAYDQLAQRLVGAKIDKSHRFTDWARRPLSDAQRDYAAADVVHLHALYPKIMEHLDKRARADWVSSEMAVLTAPGTYDLDPDRAWVRLKARPKSPKEFAVLMALAAWREREAQIRDVPRGRVIKDELLLDLAARMPRSEGTMQQIRGMPQGFERSRAASDMIKIIDEVISKPPETWPSLPTPKAPVQAAQPLVDLLKVLLKKTSEESGVAAKVIATVDDLEALANDDMAPVLALEGWRRDLFGERALQLKRGELALAVERNRVIVIERNTAKI
ncbi:MAG: ribonuclease D [Hyphomicrobiales bacterium]|nr:ribonuclease D [Hyphomicrobiales bacterium]OQW83835.1 MAG: ribonuclease D [Proteobacteria bacterium ST_bin15]